MIKVICIAAGLALAALASFVLWVLWMIVKFDIWKEKHGEIE